MAQLFQLLIFISFICYISACGCGWANSNTCGTDDGTYCNKVCCAPFRESSGNCDCGWASHSSCVSNDGSPCNQECCAPYREGQPTPPSPQTNAKTTRYYDCCKPSCSWSGNVHNLAPGYGPVRSCAQNGATTVNANNRNICGGGGNPGFAYTCADQQPFEKNGILYGFVAAKLPCCACYELKFNTPSLTKTMIVQVTNTGEDLNLMHFDIQMPGSGFGIFDGCTKQYPSFPEHLWGQRYGGVSQRSQCNNIPQGLRKGCQFRFDQFNNADNPPAQAKRVPCPNVLTSITKCKLASD